jgi:hypothetical protein
VDRSEFAQETIVLRTGRPVLAVVADEAQLVFPIRKAKSGSLVSGKLPPTW